jgi:hypothetical protein
MGLANRQFVTTLTTLLDFHKSSTICAKSFCLRAKILLQSRTTANSNSPLFQTLRFGISCWQTAALFSFLKDWNLVW